MELHRAGGIKPRYDALVVDEAQDQDTVFAPKLGAGDLPGWWLFHLALLQERRKAPVALFYDKAQRPVFRHRDWEARRPRRAFLSRLSTPLEGDWPRARAGRPARQPPQIKAAAAVLEPRDSKPQTLDQ